MKLSEVKCIADSFKKAQQIRRIVAARLLQRVWHLLSSAAISHFFPTFRLPDFRTFRLPDFNSKNKKHQQTNHILRIMPQLQQATLHEVACRLFVHIKDGSDFIERHFIIVTQNQCFVLAR